MRQLWDIIHHIFVISFDCIGHQSTYKYLYCLLWTSCLQNMKQITHASGIGCRVSHSVYTMVLLMFERY